MLWSPITTLRRIIATQAHTLYYLRMSLFLALGGPIRLVNMSSFDHVPFRKWLKRSKLVSHAHPLLGKPCLAHASTSVPDESAPLDMPLQNTINVRVAGPLVCLGLVPRFGIP
ncbi:hypothetical protein PISMIDRAFT_409183 [Pisolithus microcarpus 441]|uniref:Uncharacterized protein n=1 Tax=Pisolithus microcarpus 441 TaxID=765257 RepID=A0A0C9ZXL6_9AGAM|nr:hypothetical protein PISMIDRAFT_409183 [Pisolithus microcarpus 441]